MGTLQRYRETQRERRGRSAYRSLIATPAATTIIARAGARMRVTTAGASTLNASLLTIEHSNTTRTIRSPGGTNRTVVIDWVERGAELTLVLAGAQLQVDVGLGVWRTVATN